MLRVFLNIYLTNCYDRLCAHFDGIKSDRVYRAFCSKYKKINNADHTTDVELKENISVLEVCASTKRNDAIAPAVQAAREGNTGRQKNTHHQTRHN